MFELENSIPLVTEAANDANDFTLLGDLQLAMVGGGCGDVTLH